MYSRKSVYLLIILFFFFYILNYLTPMAFGDDYVYSFIWQGHSEYEPLIDPVVRVSSLNDLQVSLWRHYFTWSGRTVSHFLTQFFLWLGKDVFNIFNSLISLLLVIEIYWCMNKGVVSLNFKTAWICWIFFALWVFSPGFSPVFFWLSGACNYLWTAVLLLAFLLPYIRKYYFFEEPLSKSLAFTLGMFFLGIIAGWSNENSICWIILVLSYFIYVNKKTGKLENWMFSGLAGLMVGYMLLMLAPGNVARLQAETGASSGWITGILIKTNLNMLAAVLCFQFILWYFSLRSLVISQKDALKSEDIQRERMFVKALCILSFVMTVTMLFSPNFPPRSSFPGTVQLVIASSVLLRVQEEFGIEMIKKNAKKLLCFVGTVYFLITTAATFYGFYDYHVQIQGILSFVNHSKQAKEEYVTVPSLVPVRETIANMSGLHLLFYEMSEDTDDWRNAAFAHYYGIKGIRMIKPDRDKENVDK